MKTDNIINDFLMLLNILQKQFNNIRNVIKLHEYTEIKH